MEFKAAIKGDLDKILAQKRINTFKSVNRAITKASNELRSEMIGQTQRARLGYGLAKSWRINLYNKNKPNKFAKGLIYTKSPKIIEGFESGGIRRPKMGKWLAIPTDNVPKAPGRKRYTPESWPKSFPKLYFAEDNRGKSYLVGQTIYKMNSKGKTRISKTTKKTEGNAETVIYFFLVKQTRHDKKLNFAQASKRSQQKIGLYIQEELGRLEK